MDDYLLSLIRRTYMEGWSDGCDHGNLVWKYPPAEIAWTRHCLNEPGLPAPSDAERDALANWENMSYQQRSEA